MASLGSLVSVEFEVFGTVQGVFFRKFTQQQGTQLGLVGFVKNTARGTVVGCVQGPEPKVKQMKEWLSKTGSPKSSIAGCEFKDEKTIPGITFKGFDIIRPKKKSKKR